MEDLNNYNFSTKTGFNSVLLKLRYEEIAQYFKGDNCLELGSADGEGTKILLKHFKKVVAVDGSSKFLIKARNEIKNKKVTFINAKFEKLKLENKFDTIILAHILEHVANPVEILKVARKYLAKNGVVIIDVPNANSIHRQVGVYMGMLETVFQLNDTDKSIGHKRVYDKKSLQKDVSKSGLRVVREGGVFLKPFSNTQLEKMLNKNAINAFNEVGKKYPEIAAEIFVICK